MLIRWNVTFFGTGPSKVASGGLVLLDLGSAPEVSAAAAISVIRLRFCKTIAVHVFGSSMMCVGDNLRQSVTSTKLIRRCRSVHMPCTIQKSLCQLEKHVRLLMFTLAPLTADWDFCCATAF